MTNHDYCHAEDDGSCEWCGCQQVRDGEPERSGRTCPMLARWSGRVPNVEGEASYYMLNEGMRA